MRKKLSPNHWDITFIDNDEIHHYQPGWLFIPFDVYSPEDCQKPKREFSIDQIGEGAVRLLGLTKKLSDPGAIDFLEKIAALPSKVDLAAAKPVGPFGMLGALSGKEARQGLGVLMELTKAMGSLKNGGSKAVELSEPIA